MKALLSHLRERAWLYLPTGALLALVLGLASQWISPLPPRTIVFGDQSAADSRHARNLQHLPELRLIEVENCGHQTPGALLERGQLLDVLRQTGGSTAM